MVIMLGALDASVWLRAIGGSTWTGYFAAQIHPWFVQGMWWREVFGVMFLVGFVLLVWDLLTIGKGESRKMIEAPEA